MAADSLLSLSPWITVFVETLLKEGEVGLGPGSINLNEIFSSCSSLYGPTCGDRLKISIPYACRTLTWEILFSSQFPQDPPDFIFGFDHATFLPDIEKINSLANWNAKNCKALMNVLQELLVEFKRTHESLAMENIRLQAELTALHDQGQITSDDLEIYITQQNGLRSTRISQADFLLRLPIDFSRIPSYLTKEDPGRDAAFLLVTFTFHMTDALKIVPQLFLSPRVEHSLGTDRNLRIPTFGTDHCLVDYLSTICTLIRNKVEQIVYGYEKRREYICSFISNFSTSVVEFDSEGFTKLSLLLEFRDFFFILTIDLLVSFPSDQPIFTFQSIYHESQDGLPFIRVVKDYPYSPRWSADEMVERTRSFLLEYANDFQKGSLKEGIFNQK